MLILEGYEVSIIKTVPGTAVHRWRGCGRGHRHGRQHHTTDRTRLHRLITKWANNKSAFDGSIFEQPAFCRWHLPRRTVTKTCIITHTNCIITVRKLLLLIPFPLFLLFSGQVLETASVWAVQVSLDALNVAILTLSQNTVPTPFCWPIMQCYCLWKYVKLTGNLQSKDFRQLLATKIVLLNKSLFYYWMKLCWQLLHFGNCHLKY